MAEIKYEIVETYGKVSDSADKVGLKSSTLSAGTREIQNMTSETGHRATKRWGKE